MYRFAALLAIVSSAIVSVAFSQQTTGQQKTVLRGVIHVNFKDSERQEQGLNNIENILKDAPDTQLEVVCHGEGISLVTKKQSAKPKLVQSLIKKGIRFVACENTLKKKSLTKDDLLEGISTVPSGAVEVIKKQSEGYSYFRP